MCAILASQVHSRILQLPVWFYWLFVCLLGVLIAFSIYVLKKCFPLCWVWHFYIFHIISPQPYLFSPGLICLLFGLKGTWLRRGFSRRLTLLCTCCSSILLVISLYLGELAPFNSVRPKPLGGGDCVLFAIFYLSSLYYPTPSTALGRL